MTDLARIYVIGVVAILLSLLAWIGLFTNSLGVGQMLAIASALVLTIVVLTRSRRRRR
jgi:hypothetical protein